MEESNTGAATGEPEREAPEAESGAGAGFGVTDNSFLGHNWEGAHTSALIRGDAITAIRDLVENNLRPIVTNVYDPVSGTEAPAIITRSGIEALDPKIFDGYLDAPRFRAGKAVLTSLDSFIAHVNRFRADQTAVFACDNRDSPSLTAVLDYHPEGAESDPAFGRHRSHFAFPLSDEWKAWRAHNGPDNRMSMVEFAEFLEDRVIDVQHPSDVTLAGDTLQFVTRAGGTGSIATPTKLVELSTGLQVHEGTAIREAVKLSSGEGQVSFVSEHTDGAGEPLTIPTMFLIGIPVFKDGPAYQVVARLRYRTRPQLVFYYELWRTDRVFDHAFDEACEKVKDETAAPLFLGSPE